MDSVSRCRPGAEVALIGQQIGKFSVALDFDGPAPGRVPDQAAGKPGPDTTALRARASTSSSV
jgi:hypothetical protein